MALVSKKQLSDEELLNIVASDDVAMDKNVLKNASTALNNDMYAFVAEYNISAGDKRVNFEALCELLWLWRNKQRISKKKLRIFLENFITIKNNVCYVNQSLYELLLKFQPLFKSKIVIQSGYSKFSKAHLREWMKHDKIKQGKDLRLSNTELYFFYDKWAYNNTKRKGTDYDVFCKYLDNALEYIATSNTMHYYQLSKAIYDNIKKEDIEKAKEWARQYDQKKRSKKVLRS